MPSRLLRHACRLLTEKPYRAAARYRVPPPTGASSAAKSHYLVTATIVRNEAQYIREFVAFHKLVGVDHMLIYLDGGEDADVRKALNDFVSDGFVELIPWPRFLLDRNNQFVAYQHAVSYVRGSCRWLAMIDADEFLFAPASGDLKSELQKREQFAALAVYSRTFGTGGVQRIAPGQLVTEVLVMRGSDDHIKNRTQRSIVDPVAVVAVRSANSCLLSGTDVLGWDEDGRPVRATGESGHGAQSIRINHYFTRSEEDFHQKVQRSYFGRGNHAKKMASKTAEAADSTLSVERDDSLQRYLPNLRGLVYKAGSMELGTKSREFSARGFGRSKASK
jgi:hypothetical protein